MFLCCFLISWLGLPTRKSYVDPLLFDNMLAVINPAIIGNSIIVTLTDSHEYARLMITHSTWRVFVNGFARMLAFWTSYCSIFASWHYPYLGMLYIWFKHIYGKGGSPEVTRTRHRLVVTVNDFYWSLYKNMRIINIEYSHWQKNQLEITPKSSTYNKGCVSEDGNTNTVTLMTEW